MEDISIFERILEELKTSEVSRSKDVLECMLNFVMLLEREKVLKAKNYERTEERTGYANGFKPRQLNTMMGELNLQVPQTRNVDFFPEILQKWQRTEQALMLAMAEMYIEGVSTNKVKRIFESYCGMEVSSTQVSRATKMLDDKIEPWRNRSLIDESYKYLYLDATYEKVRRDGIVQSTAIFTAFGVDSEGIKRVLGYSVASSEAEIHWRGFLESLVVRGLKGVELIISDSHSGLAKARTAVFPSIPWQRCNFHLQQNAQKFARNIEQKSEIAKDLRAIFLESSLEKAKIEMQTVVNKYKKENSALANWIESNVIEGLTFFHFKEEHWKKIRTTNLVERQNRELKRRTKVIGIFCNIPSVSRLVGALLMQLDDQWLSGRKLIKIGEEVPSFP